VFSPVLIFYVPLLVFLLFCIMIIGSAEIYKSAKKDEGRS
jgi:hypothetical protein